MTPAFSRLSAAVLNAPYFYETSSSDDPQEVIRFRRLRLQEYQRLREAVQDAGSEAELAPDAREVWDRALSTIESGESDDATVAESRQAIVELAALIESRREGKA